VLAEGAFLGHMRLRIDVDGAIGTGGLAEAIDVAIPLVDDHLAVGKPHDRPRRTGFETRGIFAMVAQDREKEPFRLRVGPRLHIFDRVTEDAQGDVKLHLAGHRAGVAADTGTQIDQHSETSHASLLMTR
jgi:hypothetical protein